MWTPGQPLWGPRGGSQRRSSPSHFFYVRQVPAWHNFTICLLFCTTCLYLFSTSLLRVIAFYSVFTTCYHLFLLSYYFLLRVTTCLLKCITLCMFRYLYRESLRKFTKVLESSRRLEKVGDGREGRESRESWRRSKKK